MQLLESNISSYLETVSPPGAKGAIKFATAYGTDWERNKPDKMLIRSIITSFDEEAFANLSRAHKALVVLGWECSRTNKDQVPQFITKHTKHIIQMLENREQLLGAEVNTLLLIELNNSSMED